MPEFTLDDFADQLRKLKKLGRIKDLLKMVPGIGSQAEDMNFDEEEKELVKVEAIIQSMTPEERARPKSINADRRDHIARGSGTTRADVDDLIKQFSMMKKMMDDRDKRGRR